MSAASTSTRGPARRRSFRHHGLVAGRWGRADRRVEHAIGNDPENADGVIGRYGLSWLEVFLVGDERYRQFLEETPTQASDFQQNLTDAP